MERKKFKKILSDFGYGQESIKKILQGRQVPTVKKALDLNDDHGIPFEVWRDVKSYLKNDTKDAAEQSNTEKDEKVSA